MPRCRRLILLRLVACCVTWLLGVGCLRAQTDSLIPPSAYAARRAKLAQLVMPAAIIVNGRHLVGQHELPRQDANFWYLTGVESPYAILVMAPDVRPNAARGAIRTALFLPDTFEFAGAQFPMVDSGFRRAAWNQPRRRLAPGPEAALRTGIRETYALREFATRVKEIVANAPTIYLPRASDSLYAPPGFAKPLTIEQQTSRAIAGAFPGRAITDVTPLIKKSRLVKDQYEIIALREAAAISAQSMITLMRRVKPGMNDLEAAGILEADWKRLGAARASFAPIIGSGPKAMTFFSLSGESYDAVGRVMKAGDLLFNDYGAAEVRRYASDVCRTIPVSGTFTAEQRTYYEIVLEAQEAAIASIKPGVMMVDVIKAAARVFRAHGLEKYEDISTMGADRVWGIMPSPTHYLERNGGITMYTRFGGGVRDIGHHVGLEATDSRDWSEPLAAGMVVTVEPKIYIPEKGIAIMIEDMILVTGAGRENLSVAAPKTVAGIEAVMRRR
jgi:Xaa-Pro aminopeptidase